jgi:hypothetical protein
MLFACCVITVRGAGAGAVVSVSGVDADRSGVINRLLFRVGATWMDFGAFDRRLAAAGHRASLTGRATCLPSWQALASP